MLGLVQVFGHGRAPGAAVTSSVLGRTPQPESRATPDSAPPVRRRPAKLETEDPPCTWASPRGTPLTGASAAMTLRGSARPPRPCHRTTPTATIHRPPPPAPPRRAGPAPVHAGTCCWATPRPTAPPAGREERTPSELRVPAPEPQFVCQGSGHLSETDPRTLLGAQGWQTETEAN